MMRAWYRTQVALIAACIPGGLFLGCWTSLWLAPLWAATWYVVAHNAAFAANVLLGDCIEGYEEDMEKEGAEYDRWMGLDKN